MKIEQAKIRYPSSSKEKEQEHSTRPSVFTEGHRGEFYNIDVNKLVPFRKQHRKHFDEEALREMANTIKAHGIRQPLTVISTEDDTGRYEIVSGERRFRAAIIAGLLVVPCIIIYDKKAAVEIALIENVQRKDLHPLELAKAYQQLLDEKICANKAEIAEKLGISKSTVTETMQLLSLPDSIQTQIIEDGIVARSVFREFFETEDKIKMQSIIERYKNPAKELTKSSSRAKRKILLKVVLADDQVVIDTNALSKLTEREKEKVKQLVLNTLEQ